MKRLNIKPVDSKTFICPQCGKPRMSRPLDHKVSLEKKSFKIKNEQEIELLIDICDFCLAKNYRAYFEPTKTDIKKLLKAIHEEQPADSEKSLEDLV